jgi:hypothetical protein
LPRHCTKIYNLVMQQAIKPTTIFRHAYGIYPPMAMLAGMQLDVFTPLKDGPMTAAALASALTLETVKLKPLLYALVHAELLNNVRRVRWRICRPAKPPDKTEWAGYELRI